VDHKKGERYSKEFRQQAVERMNAGDNISRLSRELGVARHLLYHWRDRLENAHAPVGRSHELILRKQILALKRILANKTIELDFFRSQCFGQSALGESFELLRKLLYRLGFPVNLHRKHLGHGQSNYHVV